MSTKYYKARKEEREMNTRKGLTGITYPITSQKMKSAALRAIYDMELSQYNYENCRRKVWR